MAQTIGYVIETSNDGRAVVVAEKGQGCGSCSSVSHCHGGRSAGEHKTVVFNHVGAKVGDRVMLSVDSGTLLSRLALIYLVPVVIMLIGAFVGASMDGGGGVTSGGQSVGYGLAGFVLGFGISVAISRIWSNARPVTPTISRIVGHHFQYPQTGPASGCGCGGG